MNKRDLKRKCCVCKKISYNADTFGTWLKTDTKRIKKQYRNKWAEYNCINKVYL